MRAMIAAASGKLELADLPVPRPGEYESLVRMDACGICNSTDIKLLHNEFCPGPFPAVLGHEVVGTVVEIGPKTENFAVGDRVFRQRLNPNHLPGGYRSNWGGFAEYGIVTDEWAKQGKPYGPASLPHDQQKLMADLKAPLAAGMVTLMETLDALQTTGASSRKSVAIVGSGPVGQAFALFARLCGAGPVIAFGRSESRALRFGAVCGIDAYVAGEVWPAAVQDVLANGGFDIVIEAVGSAEALVKCSHLAGQNGVVWVYGVAPDSKPFDNTLRSQPNVRTLGATEGRSQAELLRWVDAGKVRLEDWVSDVLPLSDYQQGFDLVENKRALKVVLTP